MFSSQFISLMLSFFFFFTPINNNQEARVMIVGDVMMHAPVTASGYNASTHGYQFDYMFQQVKPILNQADLVIGNLETPLAGEGQGYSGYPLFNAPEDIALSLKNAGFDVLTTANNHVLDQQTNGTFQTLNYLDQYGLKHTGSFRSPTERNQPLILKVNGLKIGIIAFSYGTNGIPIPKDKPYIVNILNLGKIEQDVTLLKNNHVDYILAMVHYGTEYQRLPNELQKKWTKDMMNLGVDFVLGSHPHVVQTLELFNGNTGKPTRGVIYSLGNFLSGQIGDWKDYGMILDLTLKKNAITHKVEIQKASVIPTHVAKYTQNGRRKYQIRPLNKLGQNVDPTIMAKGKELVAHVMGK